MIYASLYNNNARVKVSAYKNIRWQTFPPVGNDVRRYIPTAYIVSVFQFISVRDYTARDSRKLPAKRFRERARRAFYARRVCARQRPARARYTFLFTRSRQNGRSRINAFISAQAANGIIRDIY